MRRWTRWLLVGACALPTAPTQALELDCAQQQPQEHTLALPAELRVTPPTQGTAFLIVDERGVDVVLERSDAAGVRIAYDLPPSDWSSTVVAIDAALEPAALRVTSLVPTRTQATVRLALWCEGAVLPPAQAEILRALDAATRAVASAGDARLAAAVRQQARDRAVALLGGVALAAARVPALAWVRAQALHTQGYLHNQSAHSAESAQAYADAAVAWRAAGDAHRALWAELRQAQQWSRRGESERALRAFEHITASEHAGSDVKLRGVATNDRCLILNNTRRLDDASACYAEALAIYAASGERGEYALTLANAADVALERGALDEARGAALRALDEARVLRLARPQALAALVLGKAERLLGNLGVATDLYLEAERAALQLSDLNLRANARRQLGSVMALRGDWSRAEYYGHSAHETYARGEYWPGAAFALLGVAQAQYERGRADEAAASVVAVLDLVERHQLDAVRATALLLRAELCVAQADAACARAALAAFEHAPGARDAARAIRAQQAHAGVHMLLGETRSAQRTLTRALARSRRAGDWFGEIQIGERLGSLRLRQGDAQGALAEFQQALTRREQLARNQLLPARLGVFTRDEREALDGHLRALRQAQGDTQPAALARLALLRRMQALLGDDLARDASTTAASTQVLQDISAAVRAHWALDAPVAADAPSVQELITQLERLNTATSAIQPAPTLGDGHQALMHPRSASTRVLVLFAGPNGVWRWWVDAERIDEYVGVTPTQLGDHAANLVRLAREPTSTADAVRAAAQELRNDLALSALSWDAETEVTIVGDRALAGLPWRLMLDGDDAGPVLATALAQSSTAAAAPCCTDAMLYAFADPTADSTATATPKAPNTRSLMRLPGSRAEVAAAARIWGAARSTVRLGSKASRAQALSALSETNAVVHFATHGLIDSAAPDLSGLLVVDGDQLGLLAWHDILAHPARARLVVLGACEAASGGAARGHGSPSLAQAFLYAGAHEVIAPLWPISDAASVRFMTAFYQALAQGQTPAFALRSAQASMRADARYAHPYYWAGFVNLTRGIDAAP